MNHDDKSTDSLLEVHEENDADIFSVQRRSASTLIRVSHYLFCFIAGCLVATALFMLVGNEHNRKLVESLYLTPVPEMEQEIRIFEWNYTFTGLPSEKSNAAWDLNFPFGEGYIFIEEPDKYNLPPGELTPNGQIYSVSLYHQIHCLKIIRRDYFTLLEGVWNNDTSIRDVALDQRDNSHNRHCLDYIRQSLECHADLTIEWARTEVDGKRFQVDGMHIAHQCKKRTAVDEFMERQKGLVEKERQIMQLSPPR